MVRIQLNMPILWLSYKQSNTKQTLERIECTPKPNPVTYRASKHIFNHRFDCLPSVLFVCLHITVVKVRYLQRF